MAHIHLSQTRHHGGYSRQCKVADFKNIEMNTSFIVADLTQNRSHHFG